MNNNSTYITEAPQPPIIDNPLRAYVDNIQSKLQHANWKQNLILSYNYLPLANIKQKLQADRINYIKKMQAQQARLKALVDNQEITTLLRNLNSFKDKLLKNADKLQEQIISQRKIVNKLQNSVRNKRQILKNIKKIKIQKVRQSLLEEGIRSARDIKYLMRSNTKTTLNSNYNQLTSRLRAQSYTKISQKSNEQIFKECIKVLQKVQYQRIEQHSSKNKKNGIHQSNYSSVPNKKVHHENIQHKITLEEFMKLNKNQLIKIIQKEDPQFQALFSLLQ